MATDASSTCASDAPVATSTASVPSPVSGPLHSFVVAEPRQSAPAKLAGDRGGGGGDPNPNPRAAEARAPPAPPGVPAPVAPLPPPLPLARAVAPTPTRPRTHWCSANAGAPVRSPEGTLGPEKTSTTRAHLLLLATEDSDDDVPGDFPADERDEGLLTAVSQTSTNRAECACCARRDRDWGLRDWDWDPPSSRLDRIRSNATKASSRSATSRRVRSGTSYRSPPVSPPSASPSPPSSPRATRGCTLSGGREDADPEEDDGASKSSTACPRVSYAEMESVIAEEAPSAASGGRTVVAAPSRATNAATTASATRVFPPAPAPTTRSVASVPAATAAAIGDATEAAVSTSSRTEAEDAEEDEPSAAASTTVSSPAEGQKTRSNA